MLKNHYEQILRQLKEDTEALAKRYPDLAVNLYRENTDPDVARLLEGVALLAARQTMALEADRNEQMQGWLQALAPESLLPTPATALAEFKDVSETIDIPAGEIFQTERKPLPVVWRVPVSQRLQPLSVTSIEQDNFSLSLKLSLLGNINQLAECPLRIQLCGDIDDARLLAMLLGSEINAISILINNQSEPLPPVNLPSNALQPVYQVIENSWLHGAGISSGVSASTTIPQWLKENWLLPHRSLAFELHWCDIDIPDQLLKGDTVTITLELNKPLGQKVNLDQIAVNVLPLVNVQSASMLPFSRQPEKSLYELAMADDRVSTEQLITVSTVQESHSNTTRYVDIASLAGKSTHDGIYQVLRQNHSPKLQIRLDHDTTEYGMVKIECFVHQGEEASALLTGAEVIGKITGKLISAPSMWTPALDDQKAQWNYLNAQQAGARRTDLAGLLHQLHSLLPPEKTHRDDYIRWSRQIDAISFFEVKPDQLTRGTRVIFGHEVTMSIDVSEFKNEADAWCFCLLIWQMLRGRLAINTVISLRITNQDKTDLFYWPHASGTRSIF